MSRSTLYAAELARAEFADCRIERIFVRETLTEVIRFSDWRGGRFNPKALEIGEDELLVLIGDAIAAGVFSSDFVRELETIWKVASVSEKQDEAMHKAFIKRQEAWRDNKEIERHNPYPPESPYHDFWRQGWQAEDDVNRKR